MKVLKSIESRCTGGAFAVGCIVLGVGAAHLVGFAVPGVWALPLVNAGVFFFIFRAPLKCGDYGCAVRLALVWATATSLLQIGLTIRLPGFMEEHIWRAAAYREEMFAWVRTGAGPEGNIRLFLPVHLKHFAVFSAASLVSGGFLGLAMGAALLGYMNFYVGSLIGQAANPVVASLLAWPVWAVVRVAGFIIAGTALGAVLVHRNGTGAGKYARIRRLYCLSLALIALDILLKWTLAGTWRGLLCAALDPGG